MTFPYRHGFSLETAARQAIDSHGQPAYALNPEARAMREQKHTGIELTGVEVAVLKKMSADRINEIGRRIEELELSLEEHTAQNRANVEEELALLTKEDDFLRHNLAEKLFGEPMNTDNEVSI